jgi:hypothetical protein
MSGEEPAVAGPVSKFMPGNVRMALAVTAAIAVAPLAGNAADAPAPPRENLQAALDTLHAEAATARKSGDLATVERLRKQRLALLDDARGASRWIAGRAALVKADGLVGSMKYAEACAVLAAAWQPFSQPARGEAVFGDIALKLFAAAEAAKAVAPRSDAVPTEQLRAALQRAVDSDPCQVEAIVATAFLATPDPAEAFEPAPLRPSLRARGKLLTQAQPEAGIAAKPLPWQAAVAFLKAADNGFVLGDLGFYRLFLAPGRRLRGVDGTGRPVHVVMGGGLLTMEPGEDDALRPVVYDYDAAAARWTRMRPRVLRVQTAASPPAPWRIDPERLVADLRRVLADATAERESLIIQRILASADGLRASLRVKADIGKIVALLKDPPKKASPSTLDEVLASVVRGYDNYAQVRPEEAQKATAAKQQVLGLSAEWSQLQAGIGPLRAMLANVPDGGTVAPETASTALAQLSQAFEATAIDSLDDAAAVAADGPAPGRLAGRDLVDKASRVKDQYDLLGLFTSMGRDHRQAIGLAAAAPAAAPGLGGPSSWPEERAQAALRQRLAAALERYDMAVGPAFSLDQLLDAEFAVREMQEALRKPGPESEQQRFLDRLAHAIAAMARPAEVEAELQGYCTPTHLADSRQLGPTIWQTFDFPAATSTQVIADLIERSPRVAFSASDLAAVEKRWGEGLPPADAGIPLRNGCTTPAPNRLVSDHDGSLVLHFLGAATDPCTVLLLDIDTGGDAAPACLATADGPPLWMEIDGRQFGTTVVTEGKAQPQIVLDLDGPSGHVPLGAKTDPSTTERFIIDGRGNRIVRDPTPMASPAASRFYAMTSRSGDPVTERSLNYSLQDWFDLDQEILTVFLPNAMRLNPALPTRQRYRAEFMRPAPDAGWLWPAPMARTP